jgi:hypothetical protein
MQAVPGLDPQLQVEVVACHHLAYFRPETGIRLT